MKSVYAITHDVELKARWRELLARQGRALRILPESNRKSIGTALLDLGQRPGESPDSLAAALNADAGMRPIVLSARPTAQEGLHWLRRGARGYCNRLASAEVLLAVLETVESGRVWAGPEVNDHLLQSALAAGPAASSPEPDRFALLTPREQTIARQVADGHSNKVIAADSGISERTVKAHLNAIFRKTGIRNRVQLALALAGEANSQRRRSSG